MDITVENVMRKGNDKHSIVKFGSESNEKSERLCKVEHEESEVKESVEFMWKRF